MLNVTKYTYAVDLNMLTGNGGETPFYGRHKKQNRFMNKENTDFLVMGQH